PFEPFSPLVTVVAAPSSAEELNSILQSVARQRGVQVHLVVVGGDEPSGSLVPRGVTVEHVAVLDVSLVGELAQRGSEMVAFFDPADWYGENYLVDAALTWRYRPDLEVAGKQRFMRHVGNALEDVRGGSYVPVRSLAVRRSLVSTGFNFDLPADNLAEWIRAGQLTSEHMLSIDRLNYLEGGASADVEVLAGVRDAEVDPGISMAELYEAAETTPSTKRTREGPGDLTGSSLHSATERRRKRSQLKVRGVRGGLEIESHLPPEGEE